MPLSAIFQLYHGDQFLVVEEAGVPGENHPCFVSFCNFLLDCETESVLIGWYFFVFILLLANNKTNIH